MIINIIVYLCLVGINAVVGQQTCPAYDDIYPCRCFELSATLSQIECVGEDVTEEHLYTVGLKITNPTGRFNELYIHDTKIGVIPANTFPNTLFNNIIIENNADLHLIDPRAFKLGTTTKLAVRRNEGLGSPLLYELARNLNPTDTIQFDGNGLDTLPINAFTPSNPATNKLKKIFLNNNKIGAVDSNAFFGLPMLNTISLEYNEVDTIQTHGLSFTSSATPRQISVRMGNNKISETSFARDAITFGENITLSLHLETNEIEYIPEFEFKYLERPGNEIYLGGNAIECDCTARWILNVIHNSTVIGIKCANLQERDIHTVTVTEMCV